MRDARLVGRYAGGCVTGAVPRLLRTLQAALPSRSLAEGSCSARTCGSMMQEVHARAQCAG